MANCVSTVNFIWRIPNFASIDTETSSVFHSLGMKWQLRFSRFKEDEMEKFCLYVECFGASELSPTGKFRATIYYMHNDGTLSWVKSAKYDFKDKEWCVWADYNTNICKTYGKIKDITFSTSITTADLTSLLKDQNCAKEVGNESLCVKSLTEDFGRLFNNDELSDFVLKCGEQSFFVHKAVLSARSDFFAGMIRSNLKESKESTAKIEDVEPDILELVLRYMYSGEFPQLSMETIQNVYTAADRFGIESLKVKCYSTLVDNFLGADEEHSNKEAEKELKNTEQNEVAKTALLKNKEKELLKHMFRSREWRAFSHEFPHKAHEMCRPLLLRK